MINPSLNGSFRDKDLLLKTALLSVISKTVALCGFPQLHCCNDPDTLRSIQLYAQMVFMF